LQPVLQLMYAEYSQDIHIISETLTRNAQFSEFLDASLQIFKRRQQSSKIMHSCRSASCQAKNYLLQSVLYNNIQ